MAGRSGSVWLGRPTSSLRYIVYCRMFALASFIRLTLPDATSDRWLPYWLMHAAGAVLVGVNGSLLGWCLCALGTGLPLLFASDQLTQSAFLFLCALSAAFCVAAARRGERHAAEGLPYVVRRLTVMTYAIAGFHKLNRDFLDPTVSCASGGLRILAENWRLPLIDRMSNWAGFPLLFVCAELGLVVLWLVRPGFGLVLALLVHLPLTIIFAPAFAFTMATGWVMLLTDADLRHLGRTLRKHRVAIASVGLALAALSISRYGAERWRLEADWIVKEAVLWVALVAVVAAWSVPRASGVFEWRGAWREAAGRGIKGWTVAACGVWLLNGVTPYLGLQFQHAGAMLSNLRIDSGCWNSLVVPEAVRRRDPYVRLESVDYPDPERRAAIAARLWNPNALWHARRAYCRERGGVQPALVVSGSYAGRRFSVVDLCRRWPLPPVRLPGYRGFQVNLQRQCPQACVH